MMDVFYSVPLLAFFVVLFLIPVGIWLAHHLEFLDHPGGEDNRKQHVQAVPPIGGIVIFPVFLGALYFSGVDFMAHWAVLAALVLVLVTGAVDDRVHVQAYIKLVAQVTASVLIIWPGGAMVDQLGNMFGFGAVELGVFAPVFSFAAVLLLINAINLSDGLDGLAGGQSFVILAWLLFAAIGGERGDMVQIIVVLMAVLAGFLLYNMRHPFRRHAALFMGDAGSMSLGVMIAFLAVSLGKDVVSSGGVAQVFSPMAVAWVIALPIMDACAQFIRRMRQGRHPFDPDRGHFHHLFVDSGVSVRRSVWVIIVLCGLFGLFGASSYLWGVPQFVLTLAWALVFGGYVLVSIKPAGFQSVLSKLV